mmetsp:Transcript_59112/g.171393  ORF Transcript_59112/g.171393 Transcript_59112/m.171393 type:complete len:223 (+) Transcript_59112:908-1576(+)
MRAEAEKDEAVRLREGSVPANERGRELARGLEHLREQRHGKEERQEADREHGPVVAARIGLPTNHAFVVGHRPPTVRVSIALVGLEDRHDDGGVEDHREGADGGDERRTALAEAPMVLCGDENNMHGGHDEARREDPTDLRREPGRWRHPPQAAHVEEALDVEGDHLHDPQQRVEGLHVQNVEFAEDAQLLHEGDQQASGDAQEQGGVCGRRRRPPFGGPIG